ncbi:MULTISPECIES: hypothetical protein [unclassified Chryseobacterium]|uniref:hypothetical protein n=1 Tax=unclassified Chryseobacterium TaxID=2593645 RepID=UPI003019E978
MKIPTHKIRSKRQQNRRNFSVDNENLEKVKYNFRKHILEKTKHAHVLFSKKIEIKYTEGSTELLKIDGVGLVIHEEHKLIKINSPVVIKYVQQEYNPVTKLMENAFD